jgi:hypothetical protein
MAEAIGTTRPFERRIYGHRGLISLFSLNVASKQDEESASSVFSEAF